MGAVSAIASAVGNFFKAIALGLGLIHDKEERQAGENKQKVVDQQATMGSLERQNKAAVDGPQTGDDAEKRLKDGTF